MNSPTIPVLRKNILVVEDNEQVRLQIARTLEIEGHIVHQAPNGQVALTLMDDMSPDLILSSVNMPVMDGIEFYRAVRHHSAWVTIPFVFLIAPNSSRSIWSIRELGVEDFLTKPINPDHLIKTISARLLRAAELQIAHIDQAYLETVNVLANTIEGRDPYTSGHVERVARYARWLAQALRWPPEQMRLLEFGARLHDIGKIIIPDHILNKPTALTPQEWELMKQHTVAGAKILRNIHHLRQVTPYVLYHHERWDGSGYPEGLRGREIPIEGRTLAIADVYDALTTARPYHPARPSEEVVKFIQMRAGSHFDPDLVNIFCQVLAERVDESGSSLLKQNN